MADIEFMKKAELAYRVGEPIITDEEWNRLVEETGYKEALFDTLTLSDSGRERFALLCPAVSLHKYYRLNDLRDWLVKNFNEEDVITIEPKLDGNFCVVQYKVNEDGTATRANIGTGGDGIIGLKINKNAFNNVDLVGIPEVLDSDSVNLFRENNCVINDTIEIRGEIIINMKSWNKKNPGRTYATWRQMTAGCVNRQDGISYDNVVSRLSDDKFTIKKNAENRKNENYKFLSKIGVISALTEAGYEDSTITISNGKIKIDDKDLRDIILSINSKISCIREELTLITYSACSSTGNYAGKFLKNITGLVTFEERKITDTIDSNDSDRVTILTNISEIEEILEYVQRFFGELRNTPESSFQCDGLVFKKYDSKDEGIFRGRGGNLSHDPSNRIAIKLMSEPIRTKIINIYDQVTDKGNTTVHATIEPIVYQGSTIENVNLHNPDWFNARKDWIFEGAEIGIAMSGDLIPVICKL